MILESREGLLLGVGRFFRLTGSRWDSIIFLDPVTSSFFEGA